MKSLLFFALASSSAVHARAVVERSPSEPATTTSSTSCISWETAYTATAAADVAAAAATAKTSSPTSKVKGKAYDRYVSIWFENTDYEKAAGDANFKSFAKKGVTMSNYYAVTHPSQPNYVSVLSGDHFGMQNDDFSRIDGNVSTVLDLLDTKGISWGFYQEDMPFSGYEGYEYKNQANGRNDYVRKHNPGVMFDSVTRSEQRLSQIKNLSMIDTSASQFHKDLAADKLPQWMFITPNMTSDAHDTDITTAGEWLHAFLNPLLDDPKFMHNTLVLVTFDENESYIRHNRIFSLLLGDAVPQELVGTTDTHFYNHYSEIASVEANWDLPTLGRWDVGANVFELVARATGDRLRNYTSLDKYYFNLSYTGVMNSLRRRVYPAPNLTLDNSFSGRKILESIKRTWAGTTLPTYYTDTVEINDGFHPPKGFGLL
ncbi:Acid phosphatase [Ceratocystis platani]|uniref:Acid phosphatase n=1 Tax=Ceratocystis fimbriata f. sp. platani TaxID=88771 RepID=A0A0F8CVQ9_CERFI|nr:Acid phosphatase [Ceratocystis platani]